MLFDSLSHLPVSLFSVLEYTLLEYFIKRLTVCVPLAPRYLGHMLCGEDGSLCKRSIAAAKCQHKGPDPIDSIDSLRKSPDLLTGLDELFRYRHEIQ